MRISDFEVDEVLSWVLGLLRGCGGFDGCAVADTDETEDGNMAFRDADDVVGKIGP